MNRGSLKLLFTLLLCLSCYGQTALPLHEQRLQSYASLFLAKSGASSHMRADLLYRTGRQALLYRSETPLQEFERSAHTAGIIFSGNRVRHSYTMGYQSYPLTAPEIATGSTFRRLTGEAQAAITTNPRYEIQLGVIHRQFLSDILAVREGRDSAGTLTLSVHRATKRDTNFQNRLYLQLISPLTGFFDGSYLQLRLSGDLQIREDATPFDKDLHQHLIEKDIDIIRYEGRRHRELGAGAEALLTERAFQERTAPFTQIFHRGERPILSPSGGIAYKTTKDQLSNSYILYREVDNIIDTGSYHLNISYWHYLHTHIGADIFYRGLFFAFDEERDWMWFFYERFSDRYYGGYSSKRSSKVSTGIRGSIGRATIEGGVTRLNSSETKQFHLQVYVPGASP